MPGSQSLLRVPGLIRIAVAQLFVFTGSQMWFVALTWLMLEVSGSGVAIGTVLMIGAVPRAVLMVFGGAAADRFSAQGILRTSAMAMAAIVTSVSALVAGGAVELWHLYVASALLGATDAFFVPAVGSLVPRMVPADRLNGANAIVQLSDMITQIVGPAAAGLLIDGIGEGATFGVNGGLFALGALTLIGIRLVVRERTEAAGSMLSEIRQGLVHAWTTPTIRLSLVVVGALSLAGVGPVTVGGAVLASERLGGPADLGWFLGAVGAGSLIGVVAAARAGLPERPHGLLIVVSLAVGVGVGSLAFVQTIGAAVAVATAMGVVIGYGYVLITTLLQGATPDDMQGRMASLLMFALFAFDPISQGLAGLLVDAGLTVVFLVPAALPILAAGAIALSR